MCLAAELVYTYTSDYVRIVSGHVCVSEWKNQTWKVHILDKISGRMIYFWWLWIACVSYTPPQQLSCDLPAPIRGKGGAYWPTTARLYLAMLAPIPQTRRLPARFSRSSLSQHIHIPKIYKIILKETSWKYQDSLQRYPRRNWAPFAAQVPNPWFTVYISAHMYIMLLRC